MEIRIWEVQLALKTKALHYSELFSPILSMSSFPLFSSVQLTDIYKISLSENLSSILALWSYFSIFLHYFITKILQNIVSIPYVCSTISSSFFYPRIPEIYPIIPLNTIPKATITSTSRFCSIWFIWNWLLRPWDFSSFYLYNLSCHLITFHYSYFFVSNWLSNYLIRW